VSKAIPRGFIVSPTMPGAPSTGGDEI
jgi:hypothetical protein